jgi:hypothetical protein
MITLKHFLIEAASEEKLTHLEHAEDHVINAGEEGFAHAFHNLEDVKDQIQGNKNKTKITTKYDGSPSIVFGHNPDNGKFFVASKSAFNKNPKLNYTFEDIEQNHGHAPGLVHKLKHALEHLPKVIPPKGVYQGDVMHSGGIKSESNPHGDVMDEEGKFHFKPNTITYSTPKNSAEGKKMANSKFGVAIHTAYHGKSLQDMKAEFGADLSHFKQHPDVHTISVVEDGGPAKMTPDQEHTFNHHIKAATEHFKQTPKQAYNVLARHGKHLKTYINSTVREGTKPSIDGYLEHLKQKHLSDIAKVKTAKAIGDKTDKMNDDLKHVKSNTKHFESILNMHHHLQQAKDQLVHSLSAKPRFEHSINGVKTKPEGYVVVRNNRPTKLVDRAEFSRANFLARPR